jgi:hypothetical protein
MAADSIQDRLQAGFSTCTSNAELSEELPLHDTSRRTD